MTPSYEQLFQAGMDAEAVTVRARIERGQEIALRPPDTGRIVRLYCERQLAVVQLSCRDYCILVPWREIEIPLRQGEAGRRVVAHCPTGGRTGLAEEILTVGRD